MYLPLARSRKKLPWRKRSEEPENLHPNHADRTYNLPWRVLADRTAVLCALFTNVDRIYGDRGNDQIHASRFDNPQSPITKEIIDCGPGTHDVVSYDEGVDVVNDTCEAKISY